MHYIATVVTGIDTYSQSFESMHDAEQWLDENNNNLESDTIIDIYNEKWEKIDGFFYTQKKG